MLGAEEVGKADVLTLYPCPVVVGGGIGTRVVSGGAVCGGSIAPIPIPCPGPGPIIGCPAPVEPICTGLCV